MGFLLLLIIRTPLRSNTPITGNTYNNRESLPGKFMVYRYYNGVSLYTYLNQICLVDQKKAVGQATSRECLANYAP